MSKKVARVEAKAEILPLLASEANESIVLRSDQKIEFNNREADISFEEYRSQWLESIREGKPSTTELGHRFASKLLTQWLDIDTSSDDLVYCDGKGDGGIDIAYLSMGSRQGNDNDNPTEGDTWYLVQSKYGSAFRGVNTLLAEGLKVIDTLQGKRKNLSSIASELLERILMFREAISELDRIILVFATEEALNEEEKQTLNQLRVVGRDQLGSMFDVDAVSIATIYRRVLDTPSTMTNQVNVSLKAILGPSGQNLRVGTVSLLDLYNFLKAYHSRTGDLNLLYEKNVRRSLGNRTRVNSKIRETLQKDPEQFGLYNNGITIVVTNFQDNDDNVIQLVEPHVVNGCQTTQMIWQVCRQRLESGGTGFSAMIEDWRKRAGEGVVIVKIVKVGIAGETLLRNIARYTNSQNAIREQDFLALESDITDWAKTMASNYNVFVETQRGEWESQQAFQQQNPQARRFKDHANAFDLIKVYGAGWIGVPGIAFSDNAPFIPPSGAVYKQIIEENKELGDDFGADDLYAAYCLKIAADAYGFGGKGANTKPSRGQTRYMFYMVVLELLSDVLEWAGIKNTPKERTHALLKLFKQEHISITNALLDLGVQLIDEYLSFGREEAVFAEPSFQGQFNSDLGSFLKWNKLGKSDLIKNTPNLYKLVSGYKRAMGINMGGQKPARDLIIQVIKS